MNAARVWLGVLLACLSGCSSVLELLSPACVSSEECPDGFTCQAGSCRQGTGVDAGLVASSSSSSNGPSSSAAGASSSSTASSREGSSSSLPTPSSSAAGTSSSASPSSSGPLCAPFTNTTYEQALPMQLNQDLHVDVCRDQTATPYFWRVDNVGQRAGAQLTLSVTRDLSDAGIPPVKVGYVLAAQQDGTLVDYFERCTNGALASETCSPTATDPLDSFFIRSTALDDGERGYIHGSRLRVSARSACAVPPTNTAANARAFLFFGYGTGAVCLGDATYFWALPCFSSSAKCDLTVTPKDGLQSMTPLHVEVDTASDAGMVSVDCPQEDGGAYVCSNIHYDNPNQYIRVRALADAGIPQPDGGAPLPASEFLVLQMRP